MLVLFALSACTPADGLLDQGFAIVGVSPDEGASDIIEAHIPELRFNAPIDPALCTPESLRVDGVHEDETVAFSVDIVIVAKDEGYRVQLTHEAAFPGGWTYLISARAGDEAGCQSVDGELLEPFASSFAVPLP